MSLLGRPVFIREVRAVQLHRINTFLIAIACRTERMKLDLVLPLCLAK